jgi:hypothetical protein
MTSVLLLLSDDDDYTAVAEMLQTQGGKAFTLNLSDGTFLSFGEHLAETIAVAPGEEALEVSGAKFLTLSGAVRIIPLPQQKQDAAKEAAKHAEQ